MHRRHYVHMGIMTILMFIAMYALMYAMVDQFANVYSNLNQVYMAGLMTAPMILIELAVMRSMYEDRRLNVATSRRASSSAWAAGSASASRRASGTPSSCAR